MEANKYIELIEKMQSIGEPNEYIVECMILWLKEDAEEFMGKVFRTSNIQGDYSPALIRSAKRGIRDANKMILMYSAAIIQLREYIERMENENERRKS